MVRHIFLLIFVGMGLMACGGEEGELAGGGKATVELTMLMRDNFFGETNDNISNPPVWEITEEDVVEVMLLNEGVLKHNWAIVAEDDNEVLLFDSGDVNGGKSATVTFSAPPVGEYMVICTIAGHFPNMQGRLVVNGKR